MRRRTVFAGAAVAAVTVAVVLAVQGVSGADRKDPEPAPTSTTQDKELGDPSGAVLPTGGATPVQMPVK